LIVLVKNINGWSTIFMFLFQGLAPNRGTTIEFLYLMM